MSKILIIFIVLVILFEFTFSSNISYAFGIDFPGVEIANLVTNLMGGVVSIVLIIPRILAVGLAYLMSDLMTINIAESCGISDDPFWDGTDFEAASPFEIFFNKYNVFDVNFFDIADNNNFVNSIKKNVAQWFYIMRLIASVALLCILIYVGIRMAISTVAEDKAKYKKMFVDWACSLALVYLLQYIAIFTIEANEVIVNFLRDVISTVGRGDINETINDIIVEALIGVTIGGLVSTFVYFVIVFQTLAFMLTYVNRMLKVAFLIIISPLISITYSIDKMGDGKAQALNTWLKEFVYTILIQPFHCIMYFAFANTAVNLLNSAAPGALISELISIFNVNFNQVANGFIVILCFKFINDGEKAIRKIFNFQDDGSKTSMAAGAVIGIAALNKATNLAKTATKGINMAKNLPIKFNKAINTDIGKGVVDKLDKALEGSKIATAVKNAKNGKVGEFARGAAEKYNKFAGNVEKNKKRIKNILDKHPKLKSAAGKLYTRYKNSMPITMAMMGAAMSYATGTSGVMEAFGMGAAFNSASKEHFKLSNKNNQGVAINDVEKQAKDDLKENEQYQRYVKNVENLEEQIEETEEKLNEIDEEIAIEAGGDEENTAERIRKQAYVDDVYSDFKAYKKKKQEYEDIVKLSKKNPADLTDEEKQKVAQIAQAKNEAQQAEDNLRRKDNALFEKFSKREQLKNNLANMNIQKDEIEGKMTELESTTIDNVIKKFKRSGTPYLIKRAENEILQKIQVYMRLQKAKAKGDNVSEEDFELSEDEIEYSKQVQKMIIRHMDREELGTEGKFDAEEFARQNFKGNKAMSDSLVASMNDLVFQRRAKRYNTTRDNAKSMGAEGETHDYHVKKGVMKSIR